jgi:hypothetical protein
MCLIVDANVMSRVFLKTDDPNFAPVRVALFGPGAYARVAWGGTKLSKEYGDNVARVLVKLDQAGRARKIPSGEVDAVEKSLKAQGGLSSDDPHIVALAQVSGVRLLCSLDTALHEDFKNPPLLSKPRGAVYQTLAHQHLLKSHCRHRSL